MSLDQDTPEALNISVGFQSMNPLHRVEIEEVDIHDMWIDPIIQRGEEPGEITEIVSKFNEAALGTLTVSARRKPGRNSKGMYAMLDGQQRRAALLQLEAMGKWPAERKVRVLVHYNLSIKEEAQLFLDLNYRRAVQPLRRFKTRIIAEEPISLKIKSILDSFDIHLSTGPRGFQAVNTAERIITQDGGEERFRWCLYIIREIYDTNVKGSWDGRIIEALSLVHASYSAHLDEERLIKKLSSMGDRVSKLLGAGRTRQELNGGQIHFNIAEAILYYYNQSRSIDTKKPKKLPPLPRRRAAVTSATEAENS